MQIIQCPHCAKRVGRTEGEAGQRAKCPHCQGIFMLPDLPPGYEEPPPEQHMIITARSHRVISQTHRQPARDPFQLIVAYWPVPTGLVGIIVVVAGLYSDPPADLIQYIGFVLFAAGASTLAVRSAPYSWKTVTAVACILASTSGIAARGYFDTITETTTTATMVRIDTVRRFSRQTVWRNVTIRDELGERVSWAAGPTSPDTGTPHGPWSITVFDPYESGTVWFWYGEYVSEADWHRMNK
jgi:hypothetical protein